MSFKTRRAAVALAALLLGGCDTIHANGSTDPGFGEAVKFNAAAQIIDPDPQLAEGAAMPGENGAVGAAAAKRYRTDAVKPVETIQTSTSATTGTSSGSR